jgi:hypothetical protein
MVATLLLIAVVILACGNGACDNCKGAAALWGGGAAGFRLPPGLEPRALICCLGRRA